MDNLNDPRISAYKPQRRLAPVDTPGPHKLSEAQKKKRRAQEARAEARAERLHLAGLTNAAVLIMALLIGVAVVIVVFVAISHH